MGQEPFDIAIVGGGIAGLAAAHAATAAGLRTALFERSPRALGASVRNFGMVWPAGQAPGVARGWAMRSREIWLGLAQQAGLWVYPCGSVILAYRADEQAVLEEFAAAAPGRGIDCALLTPAETLRRAPAVVNQGLRAGLWSTAELAVSPRNALPQLTSWLEKERGVTVHFGTAVRAVDTGRLEAADGRTWRANRILICSGADTATLFPDILAAAPLRTCKLQMMRTPPQPGGWRLGPHVAGPLSLRHYASFAACPSLPALAERVAREQPELVRFGIHVMAAQNAAGEVLLGDSHEYGEPVNPFDRKEIEDLILEELHKIVALPSWSIAERWHGVYAAATSGLYFEAEPRPGVRILTGLGGAGMTLSFALAEDLLRRWG